MEILKLLFLDCFQRATFSPCFRYLLECGAFQAVQVTPLTKIFNVINVFIIYFRFEIYGFHYLFQVCYTQLHTSAKMLLSRRADKYRLMTKQLRCNAKYILMLILFPLKSFHNCAIKSRQLVQMLINCESCKICCYFNFKLS